MSTTAMDLPHVSRDELIAVLRALRQQRVIADETLDVIAHELGERGMAEQVRTMKQDR